MSDTCDKGDVGVAMVISKLSSHGIKVAVPLSAHLSFDLIAISNVGKLSRMSVKHRKYHPKRGLFVNLQTVYKNSSGNHIKIPDKSSYDSIGIYCPDNGNCYFILNTEVSDNGTITLRDNLSYYNDSQNQHRMNDAKEYLDPRRIFLEVS